MNWLFPPFEPEDEERARSPRFRRIPTRLLIPNLITLLALCMGLTAIRMALEARFEWAVAAIVIAAVLDSLDGRIARLLKSTSRFGAELDSLADFVNFGVAPAVLLYNWSLSGLKSAGWIGVLAFSLCCALRLARFNVALERPRPAWMSKFFVGMPAPAGAITLLLPIYVEYLGILDTRGLAPVNLVYCAAISFLMVSRVPTFSGKALGMRVSRDLVMPIFVLVVLFAAFLLSFPWLTLATGTIAYLGSIPVSLWRYREFALAGEERKKAEAEEAGVTILPPEPDEDRPTKLH
jgi:CDP-diacylglycerol---serine O-phosphatidyltransferase